jgi:hypothetical protein
MSGGDVGTAGMERPLRSVAFACREARWSRFARRSLWTKRRSETCLMLASPLREKRAFALAHELPVDTCVDRLAGDLRPPLDPLWVNAGSTQRQETAANAELTGITETGN